MIPRLMIRLIVVLLLASSASAEARNVTRQWSAAADLGEPRLALVIGNSAYAEQPLRNPVNDAALIARTLNGLGFSVVEVADADQQTMKRAIVEFGRELRQAGANAVGLFYYAGHGVQVGAENYLVPVGAPIVDEADIDIYGVSANNVLQQMESAPSRIDILILDACRNNPFARSFRSATRGLSSMTAPSGSLVAFATAPGEVAADGDGLNSLYTQTLAAEMTVPGRELSAVFKAVAARMEQLTRRAQVPWIQSSITGDFFFKPAGGGAPTAVAAEPAAPAPPAAAGPDPRAIELAFWNGIATSDNPALFESYLERYPNGMFAVVAQSRLEELRAPGQQAALEPVQRASPPAATPPEEVERRLELSREERRQIQEALGLLGFEAGGADGLFGGATRDAITRFQEANRLASTGYLTAALARRLLNEWDVHQQEQQQRRAAPAPSPEPATAVAVAKPPALDPSTCIDSPGYLKKRDACFRMSSSRQYRIGRSCSEREYQAHSYVSPARDLFMPIVRYDSAVIPGLGPNSPAIGLHCLIVARGKVAEGGELPSRFAGESYVTIIFE